MRDLAHEENMNAEEEFKWVKTEKWDLKDKLAMLQAELTKAKFNVQRFQSENQGINKQIKNQWATRSAINDKSANSKNIAVDDTKRQLDELYDLRDALVDNSKRETKPTVSENKKHALMGQVSELKNQIYDDL